jgi:hypothetical protein
MTWPSLSPRPKGRSHEQAKRTPSMARLNLQRAPKASQMGSGSRWRDGGGRMPGKGPGVAEAGTQWLSQSAQAPSPAQTHPRQPSAKPDPSQRWRRQAAGCCVMSPCQQTACGAWRCCARITRQMPRLCAMRYVLRPGCRNRMHRVCTHKIVVATFNVTAYINAHGQRGAGQQTGEKHGQVQRPQHEHTQ